MNLQEAPDERMEKTQLFGISCDLALGTMTSAGCFINNVLAKPSPFQKVGGIAALAVFGCFTAPQKRARQ